MKKIEKQFLIKILKTLLLLIAVLINIFLLPTVLFLCSNIAVDIITN